MRIMLGIVADTFKPNRKIGIQSHPNRHKMEAILSEREMTMERVLKKRIPILFPVPHPLHPTPTSPLPWVTNIFIVEIFNKSFVFLCLAYFISLNSVFFRLPVFLLMTEFHPLYS